jgi:hypothetical protein
MRIILIVQSFFSEETRVVSHPDADVGTADRTVSDPHTIRGKRSGGAKQGNQDAADNDSLHSLLAPKFPE